MLLYNKQMSNLALFSQVKYMLPISKRSHKILYIIGENYKKNKQKEKLKSCPSV